MEQHNINKTRILDPLPIDRCTRGAAIYCEMIKGLVLIRLLRNKDLFKEVLNGENNVSLNYRYSNWLLFPSKVWFVDFLHKNYIIPL